MKRSCKVIGVIAFAVLFNACGSGTGEGLAIGQAKSALSWPVDAALDYSAVYQIAPLKSAGVDDAYNVWLLDESDRVGVLRPGDLTPTWFSGLGQAGRGFMAYTLCGGSADHAYVGYLAYDLASPGSATPEEKLEGDADFLRLNPDGSVEVEQHLSIVNSKDPSFDESRSVLTCAKVMRGPVKGDIFFGTNHGVTRVRGTQYNDHRHSVWADSSNTMKIGYNYAVSITQDGDVFLGNEWKIAILGAPPLLEDWTNYYTNTWKLDTTIYAVGTLEDMDYWRATAQTVDRRYYVGSLSKGLWEITISPRSYSEVKVPNTKSILALAATDDGSLFIGTGDQGLWKLNADKTLVKVDTVPGSKVTQLVYDPTIQPSMLLVVSDGRLYGLRGY